MWRDIVIDIWKRNPDSFLVFDESNEFFLELDFWFDWSIDPDLDLSFDMIEFFLEPWFESRFTDPDLKLLLDATEFFLDPMFWFWLIDLDGDLLIDNTELLRDPRISPSFSSWTETVIL